MGSKQGLSRITSPWSILRASIIRSSQQAEWFSTSTKSELEEREGSGLLVKRRAEHRNRGRNHRLTAHSERNNRRFTWASLLLLIFCANYSARLFISLLFHWWPQRYYSQLMESNMQILNTYNFVTVSLLANYYMCGLFLLAVNDMATVFSQQPAKLLAML